MNEERRGEEARRLLAEPLLEEAFRVLEERIVNQMAAADVNHERAEYLRTLLVANRKIRQYLEQIVATGTMAALDEQQKRTFADRLRRFAA